MPSRYTFPVCSIGLMVVLVLFVLLPCSVAAANSPYATYDAGSAVLHLPELDAGDLGVFELDLLLLAQEPITFGLDVTSLGVTTATGSPVATYNPATGHLVIPAVAVDDSWWQADLQLLPTGQYHFEVINLEPAASPDEGTPPESYYPIVDTGQAVLFDAATGTFDTLQPGQAFFGQDANYQGTSSSYTDHGDGTVTDNVTGLMWQRTPDFNGDGVIDVQDKQRLTDAIDSAATFDLAGHTGWRLPTIKELYSLINFSGTTGTAATDSSQVPADAIPFLDTDYFEFAYGDTAAGERYIDAQYWSATIYGSTTMGGNPTAFGVNFADGRIKGYPYGNQLEGSGRYVRYVRGNADYGSNLFSDNGDGTIDDAATGLTWLQQDSGAFGAGLNGDGSLNWEQALAWCENLDYAGHSDWRLPSIKELQSLADYQRAPDTTGSAAIDALFDTTYLPGGINSSGQGNYPYFWSSTTHVEGGTGDHAAYIAFGEARGYWNSSLEDVHGAGAQRSDPKSGDPSPYIGVGHGPQGDVISIFNFARCVTGGVAGINTVGGDANFNSEDDGSGGGQVPQEAFEACQGLSAEDFCTVQTVPGNISGSCTLVVGELVCVPADGLPVPSL